MKRDYARDLTRAWRSCIAEVAAWSAATLAAAVALLWLVLGGQIPPALEAMRPAGCFAAGTLALLFGVSLTQAIRRKRGLRRISNRSFYAVMLTAAQQKRIVKRLSAQTAIWHYALFAALLLPIGVLMVGLYTATGDTSCLLALAAVALVLLLLTVTAEGLQAASFATKDGFCTLSDSGILVGEDVLTFSAADGDVWAVVRFDDCYALHFVTPGPLGIPCSCEFPLPVGGAVSSGEQDRDADLLLARELGVGALLSVAGGYRPIRRSEIWQAAGFVTGAEPQDAPVLPEADCADAARSTTQGEQAPVNEKRLALFAAVLLLAVLAAAAYSISLKPAPQPPKQPDPAALQQPGGQGGSFEEQTPISQPFQGEDGAWYVTVAGEQMLLVNRQFPLPETFGGEDEAARDAMDRMIADAAGDGVPLYIVSGYRSFATQKRLYDQKVEAEGQEQADLWVARPGNSEHQTGLAFDVNETGNDAVLLNRAFADTEAFSWLAAHAAKYGFILRYPENGTAETGYGYEPWHYRYVGEKLAAILVESGETVERFLGLLPENAAD